jgi:signal peptidase I
MKSHRYQKPEAATLPRLYLGRSMTGTFRPGDRLAVTPVCLAEIRRGDVVVFRLPNSPEDVDSYVHRVVALTPEGLRTQGDNNDFIDANVVTAGQLLGRVSSFTRDGKAHRVRGGRWGRLHVWLLHTRHWVRSFLGQIGHWPYSWLKASDLVARYWQPEIKTVRVASADGPVVKYVHGGRTVARWWPEKQRFECRKPFDLVIPHPESPMSPAHE